MEYSKDELKQFEKEMEVYKVTKNISDKDYTFYDENKFYKDNGGLNQDGSIVLYGYNANEGKVVYNRPILYIELREKLQQLYKYLGKKEFAIKKSMENLAEQVSVKG